MKIALIKQKTGYDMPLNFNSYLMKVLDVIKESRAEIVIGPELAISNGGMISLNELNNFTKTISLNIDSQMVVPGTALVKIPSGRMINTAPVIIKENVYSFNKKSSIMENEIAKRFGLDYTTGEDHEGFLDYLDKSVAIEICRDHGHGKLRSSTDKNADLEIILGCNLGGFSPEKTVLKDGGVVAVVDGNHCGDGPEVYACRKDIKNFIFIEEKEKRDYSLVEI